MAKEKHLYDFSDYKTYLNYRCNAERGTKAALAQALQCQSAYISQVLNNNSHLSIEQADFANTFFMHSEKESQYFLLLVQEQRAGTVQLRRFLKKQIDDFLSVQLSYLSRHEIKDSLSPEAQAVYYSSWEYNAIHMAVTIPRLQTKDALMKAFMMPDKRFNKCMEFLLEQHLVKRSGNHYVPGTVENYLDKSSPFVRQLHLNTRAQALLSLDRERVEDAHYSAVLTMSLKDMVKVKKIINEALAEIVEVVKDSKEEQICGLSIDFFDFEKMT